MARTGPAGLMTSGDWGNGSGRRKVKTTLLIHSGSQADRSMRLRGGPGHEPFGLESGNDGGARSYSLAISEHGAI
jgi:hypothetical protein